MEAEMEEAVEQWRARCEQLEEEKERFRVELDRSAEARKREVEGLEERILESIKSQFRRAKSR